ncbi:glycosyltransferase family 4 protein [Streptomyces sp. NPDC048639]|uniref:glycosyltransferase family 4 protein n=1 Tax=Streptomyces sp. NPDC048639 TaxID=3365581 RepID=UPI0037243C4D
MPQHKREGRRLTVLHISQPVDGGVARVVTDLVRNQIRAGLHSLVACPTGGVLGEAAAAAGAGVLHWPARRAPGPHLPLETLRLSRLIRQTSPDVVHAHSAKAGLAARLAVRGRIPTVFQPHAWSFEAVDGTASELALYWERFAARWATRVLCVSEDERRRGHAAGVTGRWAVIRNGVDTEHFRPADRAARERARAGLAALSGLPPRTPLVVCVGRICRQKGQDVLLRAWPGVLDQVPGAVLALVGDGPAREELRQGAPAQVLFAGPTTDPAAWYAAADLVVLPSRWEGMALAPLEAMACGRPVVMTEVTGARESLPSRHAARCLVPPENPDALARAVAALLLHPRLRDTLGMQAQEHAHGAHDVRGTAAAVDRLYRELLRPAPAVHRVPGESPPSGGRGPLDRSGPSPESREHSRR